MREGAPGSGQPWAGCSAAAAATHLLGRYNGNGVLWGDGDVVRPCILLPLHRSSYKLGSRLALGTGHGGGEAGAYVMTAYLHGGQSRQSRCWRDGSRDGDKAWQSWEGRATRLRW